MKTTQSGRSHARVLKITMLLLLAAFVLALPRPGLAEEATATATEEKKDASAEAKPEENKAEASESKEAKPAAEEAKKASDVKSADAAPAAAEKNKDSKLAEAEKKGEEADSKSKTATDSKPKTSSTSAAKPAARTKRDKVRLALFTLKDTLPESSGQVGPFGESQLDLREMINRLERAAKDKSIAGIVFDIQSPQIGRGKVEELRGAISRVRAAGKKTYALMESAMPSDYLVACACDEIVLPETGVIMLPGIHAEATFYKKLLGKLGIEADFIHIGEYKGAAEPMTREEFSEPVRENMTALIDSLYDDLVTTIVKDRPISIAQAKEIIDTGLLTAKQAKELGLIDRIAYPETLRDELAKNYEAEPLVYVKNYGQKEVNTDFSGPTGFFKLMQAMMGSDSSSRAKRGKKIAIVYAVGPIMSGKSQSDLFGGQIMGATTIIDALREANNDDDVEAIVLRVDSPGGSAIASDLIWHETQVIKKPIVASMGDVAASGGYYISMGTDRILATPGTVTGSIGVVGGKMAMRGLFDKIGITTETIERGRNSGLFSSSGKFTESQRAVVKNMMEDMYQQFTSKAAEGRKMPVEDLKKLAGGRVYTGRQAKELKLIDQLGTLDDAIVEAKKLAGIDADTDIKIEVLPKPTNFLETLFGNVDAEKEVRLARGLEQLSPEMMEVARRAHRVRTIFKQPVTLMLPFELEIK